MTFAISDRPIDPAQLRRSVENHGCGAVVMFDGVVRDHNQGRPVLGLEYEVYRPLAESEGEAVLQEARHRFEIQEAVCVHREGKLALGDLAVVVVVAAAHRDAAFSACRYIIDEVKRRLPIWKKERYADGESVWVNCAQAGAAGDAEPTC